MGKRRWPQIIIDFYADLVGGGIGVLFVIAVFAVWLGCGHLMNWNANWWLIIGTYIGEMGFIDGFVLREAYHRIIRQEEKSFHSVAEDDLELFEMAGLKCPLQYTGLEFQTSKSINFRVSVMINKVCSSSLSVSFAVLVVIALICAASGMHWSATGQLIANTPKIIIEGFFLLV